MSERLVRCHLSGLPYHVTRAELNGWLQETSTFFGVAQKITRRRRYDVWSNNNCTAFICVRGVDSPKTNKEEMDLGVSCGQFDYATHSPEQEHLDALQA